MPRVNLLNSFHSIRTPGRILNAAFALYYLQKGIRNHCGLVVIGLRFGGLLA